MVIEVVIDVTQIISRALLCNREDGKCKFPLWICAANTDQRRDFPCSATKPRECMDRHGLDSGLTPWPKRLRTFQPIPTKGLMNSINNPIYFNSLTMFNPSQPITPTWLINNTYFKLCVHCAGSSKAAHFWPLPSYHFTTGRTRRSCMVHMLLLPIA